MVGWVLLCLVSLIFGMVAAIQRLQIVKLEEQNGDLLLEVVRLKTKVLKERRRESAIDWEHVFFAKGLK